MMVELTLVAKVTVVFAVAIGAAWVTRSARASLRSLILASAFAIVFLLPIGSAVAPARQVEIPVSYAATFLIEEMTVEPERASVPAPQLSVKPPRPISLPSFTAMARTAWIAGAVVFVVPLVVGLWRTRRLRRGSRTWVHGQRVAAHLSGGPGSRCVRVLLHDQILAPMTCGWMRPVILMPADAGEWAASDARQALLHELEHIRRHDWPIQVLARVTCALYWFHPAAWLAWRQLRLESERACDDAVVARADSTAYAEQLVSLARKLSQHSPVPLLSMADRRTLSVRVSSILSRTAARGRVGRRGMAFILGGAVALALAIAPVRAVHLQEILKDAIRIPVATEGASFEVASVKPNLPDDRLRVNDWQPMTGRLTLRNLTPQTMLTIAYATTATLFLPDDRLLGVPDWARQERFTIEAVAGRPVTTAEMQRMLRRVLVERFGLRVHVEQREESALRLTMARADRRLGPDLRPADETNCKSAHRPRGGSEAWGPQSLTCTTIDLLALELSERLGRPVLNQTGLTGNFDGTLSYAPSAEELTAIYRLTPSELPPAAMTGPALPTALREQLGLALESTRAAIDVLVVDHIDRPTSNDAPGRGDAVAGQAGAPAAFDVASIRLNTSGSETSRGPMIQPGNRLLAQNVAARAFIATAYGLQWAQIVGGPGWLDSEYWDVEARAPETASAEDVRAMMRTLLAGRFGLVSRHETRQQEVYMLTPTGSKRPTPGLRAAADPCSPIQPARLAVVFTPGSPVPGGAPVGEPVVSLSSPPRCQRMSFPGFIAARQIRMPEFAVMLTWFARRPVIDRSGMAGEYDIDLTFAPDPALSTGDAVSLFTAIQKQLGLKLEATSGPVDVLVIDSAEQPGPN